MKINPYGCFSCLLLLTFQSTEKQPKKLCFWGFFRRRTRAIFPREKNHVYLPFIRERTNHKNAKTWKKFPKTLTPLLSQQSMHIPEHTSIHPLCVNYTYTKCIHVARFPAYRRDRTGKKVAGAQNSKASPAIRATNENGLFNSKLIRRIRQENWYCYGSLIGWKCGVLRILQKCI